MKPNTSTVTTAFAGVSGASAGRDALRQSQLAG
jgi:hypothetical protein